MTAFGVPEKYADAHLGEFPEPLVRVVQEDVNHTPGYFITGPTGTGKTHLACAILKRWVATGRANVHDKSFYHPIIRTSALFAPVPWILLSIKEGFKGAGELAKVKSFTTVQAMVIDDVGAELETQWALATLYTIISDRVNRDRPTVVTSNKTLDEIGQTDSRIQSRLSSYQVITLQGRDRRQHD